MVKNRARPLQGRWGWERGQTSTGTGPCWFGDRCGGEGCFGTHEPALWDAGWKTASFRVKCHGFNLIIPLVDAHTSIGKGLMISATSAVFFIGMITPDRTINPSLEQQTPMSQGTHKAHLCCFGTLPTQQHGLHLDSGAISTSHSPRVLLWKPPPS